MPHSPSSRNIEIAAEAITAGQFARLGFDVSVQYGANQPQYDLVIGKERLLKISVKGSQYNKWGLCQKYKRADNTYLGMIDEWFNKLDPQIIFCLVSFHNIGFEQLPHMYLAYPHEIAQHLKASRGGEGSSILYIEKTWNIHSVGKGSKEEIPRTWHFSTERIQELLN